MHNSFLKLTVGSDIRPAPERRRRVMVIAAIAGVAGTAVTWGAHAQKLTPVRLLLLRRPGISVTNECVAPCIRGSVFDVSDLGDAGLNFTSLAQLGGAKAICDVIERPWANNKPSASSVPRGKYKAKVRFDPTKSWMKDKDQKPIEDRAWRIELEDRKPRTAIQFHYGNDVKWSEGCFIVGSLLQAKDEAGITATYCKLGSPELAVRALREAVTGPGRNSEDLVVGVADATDLFPDYKPQKPC